MNCQASKLKVDSEIVSTLLLGGYRTSLPELIFDNKAVFINKKKTNNLEI